MAGPLDGVRVLDLSMLLPGPLCSQHLADMGAEVIKIENPRLGDGTRYLGEKIKQNQAEESAMFLLLNRNKKSITLNLKREGGKRVFLKLLEKTDVLLEGFRPGTMAELGLGFEDLKEKYPRLIYCAISGYGASGPLRDMAGHDGNFQARSGLLSLNKTPHGEPVLPGFQIADVAASFVALAGILAALYAREKTGRGQFVDVSMLDSAFNLIHLYAALYLATGKNPRPGYEVLSGKLPNYAIYKTKEGRYVMLAALEERFFRTFLRQIGKEEILEGKNWEKEEDLDYVRREISAYFRQKTLEELEDLFRHSDVCLSPVKELGEVFHDEQLKARGQIVKLPHPRLGEYTALGSPFFFSETPISYRFFPPGHGEHTKEILEGLGFSDKEMEELRQNREI
ncbi:MAG: CoA transferase [Leptospiraceae bacterium]|nr:CoA transferase [Leptospiraceae bacterium]MDW8306310.1 CoA transferase [Leptospiraceae bacterium]